MRGYQKKVIHLKKTNSALFDEAYFIVKKEAELSGLTESDMVALANQIIEESLGECEPKERRERRKLKMLLPPFLLGALFSSSLLLIIYFSLLA